MSDYLQRNIEKKLSLRQNVHATLHIFDCPDDGRHPQLVPEARSLSQLKARYVVAARVLYNSDSDVQLRFTLYDMALPKTTGQPAVTTSRVFIGTLNDFEALERRFMNRLLTDIGH